MQSHRVGFTLSYIKYMKWFYRDQIRVVHVMRSTLDRENAGRMYIRSGFLGLSRRISELLLLLLAYSRAEVSYKA
jgi:hypothetical protein